MSSATIERPLDRLIGLLDRVRPVGRGWVARCPAHVDRDPSLSIAEGDDGRVLLYCHAGCSFDQIVAALGLDVRDLFGAPSPAGGSSQVLQEYRYCDEDGTILYVVERRVPKGFRQKRPDGNGGWVWRLDDVRRVPYRLPEVLTAVAQGHPILIVEGEKDVDRLRAAGFVATCNSGGAGKWAPDFAPHFAGADVVVVPDNDDPGRAHAADVVRTLSPVVARMRFLELAALAVKGDVFDWFEAGGTAGELRALIDKSPDTSTVVPSLPARVEVKHPGDPYPNATIFVDDQFAHPDGRLLLHERSTFYAWDTRCWPELPGDELRSKLWKFFDRAVYWEPPNGWLRFQPTKAKVENLVSGCAALVQQPGTMPAPCWLDGGTGRPSATEMIACRNGLLHVPTRTLSSHTPRFYAHHSLPFDYDANASRPERWHRFLDELWDDDLATQETLQEMFGYLLVGATHLQKMFLIIGPPRSGKGTIARVLTGLVGTHNVAGATLSGLSTNFGLAPLINAPVAVIADARLRSDQEVITERLLSISGEDTLTVDRKYREAWTGRIPARIVIMTNELPRLGDASSALANRFIILECARSFLGQEDPTLTDALLRELPGIFNWALDGLDRLTGRGYFVQPEAATELMHELVNLGSPVKAFVEERCELDPAAEVSVQDVYDSYLDWCRGSGRHAPSVQAFGRDLRAVLPGLRTHQRKLPSQHRVFEGIRLLVRGASHRHW